MLAPAGLPVQGEELRLWQFPNERTSRELVCFYSSEASSVTEEVPGTKACFARKKAVPPAVPPLQWPARTGRPTKLLRMNRVAPPESKFKAEVGGTHASDPGAALKSKKRSAFGPSPRPESEI